MRQFWWGVFFGALAVYGYTYYGYRLTGAKHELDTWRDKAVTDTSGYSAGRKK
jgi:hypothetical protein